MVFWQSKQILKSGNSYQAPAHIVNRPKGVDLKLWQEQVKEFKYNKLVILDKVPKVRRDDKDKKKDKDKRR